MSPRGKQGRADSGAAGALSTALAACAPAWPPPNACGNRATASGC